MKNYSEKLTALQIILEETALDDYWTSAERDELLKKLTHTLREKWF